MQGTIRLHVSFGVWRLILSARLIALSSGLIKAELRTRGLPLELEADDLVALIQQAPELFTQIETQDPAAPIPTCRCKLQQLEIVNEFLCFHLQPQNNFDDIQDLLNWLEIPLATSTANRNLLGGDSFARGT